MALRDLGSDPTFRYQHCYIPNTGLPTNWDPPPVQNCRCHLKVSPPAAISIPTEIKLKCIIVISVYTYGLVPCKGYHSSQLIGSPQAPQHPLGPTGPSSHLCNNILDCIDRSDETGCQDPLGSSEVNEGIKMKVM